MQVSHELDKLSIVIKSLPNTNKLQAIISSLQECQENYKTELKAIQYHGGLNVLADKYWEPFKLSLHPSLPSKLKQCSLDCIQRLAAHHLLKGSLLTQVHPNTTNETEVRVSGYFSRRTSIPNDIQDFSKWNSFILSNDSIPPIQPTPCLIDDIIQAICTCFSAFAIQDDGIHLSIVKVLLTLLTSSHIQVHSSSLIKVLQTCFYIHSHSKIEVNGATAKASLTQIVNSVTQRMERTALNNKVLQSTHQHVSPDSVLSISESLVAIKSNLPDSVPVENELVRDTALDGILDGALDTGLNLEPIQPLTEQVKADSQEQIQTQQEQTQEKIEGEQGHNPYVPDPIFYDLLCKDDVYLMIRFLSSMAVSTDGKVSLIHSEQLEDSHVDQLCPMAIKSRLLALELLLGIFTNAGPALSSSNENMIQIIKNYICVVISRNAMVTETSLFECSISLFLLILKSWLPFLKRKVQILLNNVFLHILEMESSSFRQKSMVLQGLAKLCQNPQILVSIFVNYDCDVSCVSLFDRISSICVKIAQGNSLKSSNSPGFISMATIGLDSRLETLKFQESRLKARALLVIVSIVSSLYEWSSVDFNQLNNPLTVSHSHSQENDSNSNSSRRNSIASIPIILGKSPLDSVVLSTSPLAPPLVHSTSLTSTSLTETNGVGGVTGTATVQELANRKQSFKQAIRIFNIKPSKGFILLSELELFDSQDAHSIAKFFQTCKELSKSSIGEYLGEGNLWNISVMHSFIDLFDFSGLEFVNALRMLLQSFRLPGEAQKIDRIMEKFADRYCENNPSIFAKADTAYTLAFSVMMLNTDQHSPCIKHRMDKSAFIRMNRGINDEQDLPESFLESIFDEIQSSEIILEDEATTKMNINTNSNVKTPLNNQWKKEIVLLDKNTTRQLLSMDSRDMTPFKSVNESLVGRPMFQQVCWSFMAVFGLLFESTHFSNPSWDSMDSLGVGSTVGTQGLAVLGKELGKELENQEFKYEEWIILSTLKGFTDSIHLETERDAFISSLSTLTSLNNMMDIKLKNILAIQTLLNLVNSLKEYLESSWKHVFKIISLLERGVFASSASLASSASSANNNGGTSGGGDGKKSIDQERNSLDKTGLKEFQKQYHQVKIDYIFSSSTSLSLPAISSFIESMVSVSVQEMDGYGEQGLGRMYMLQKLVEVASYNLDRIRYEWIQIWRLLQPHFNHVACHSNPSVSSFAVDSLRQLSLKFLSREELSNYSTQFEFIKGFEWIMKHNEKVHDLVLSSLQQMIAARGRNLRSGWKSIFIVLLTVPKQYSSSPCLLTAWNILLNIFSQLDLIFSSHSFVEFISCVTEFAILDPKQSNQEIIASSLELLIKSWDILFKKYTVVSLDVFHLEWLPILVAFSKIVIHSPTTSVRTQAVETLFRLLQESGHLFESEFWKPIHRNVIYPIFDELSFVSFDFGIGDTNDFDGQGNGNVSHTNPNTNPSSNPSTISNNLNHHHHQVQGHNQVHGHVNKQGQDSTDQIVWISSLCLWVETISKYYHSMKHSHIIKSCLNICVEMMGIKNEKLAPTGQTCLGQFLLLNFAKSIELQEEFILAIESAFYTTLASELVVVNFPLTSLPMTDTDTPKDMEIPECFKTSLEKEIYKKGQLAARKSFPNPLGLGLHELDFEHTIIKCVVHLDLVICIGNALLSDSLNLSKSHESRLTTCLYDSYLIASYFNLHYELRLAIWKRGMVQQMPNLLKQETTCLSFYLRILFRNGSEGYQELFSCSMQVLDRFIDYLSDSNKNQRDISMWSPVVVVIYNELLRLGVWDSDPMDMEGLQMIHAFYNAAIKIGMSTDRGDVRLALQLFLEKVGIVFLKSS